MRGPSGHAAVIGRTDLSIVVFRHNGSRRSTTNQSTISTAGRTGGNVTGVYEKLYAAQSLKVMAQAVPRCAAARR